jgi:hypothetical protein
MGRRHYPPAVILHVPHCREGQSLPVNNPQITNAAALVKML